MNAGHSPWWCGGGDPGSGLADFAAAVDTVPQNLWTEALAHTGHSRNDNFVMLNSQGLWEKPCCVWGRYEWPLLWLLLEAPWSLAFGDVKFIKTRCSAADTDLRVVSALQVAIIAGNFELAEYIKNHKETDIGEWAW
jgi:hypothetical protein